MMQNLFRAVPRYFRPNLLPAWYSPLSRPFSTKAPEIPVYPRREGSPLKLGQMTLEQFKTCCEWASKEGWYICKGDAEAFFESDPSGFFGGEINGEFVCCYTGFKHEDYCFLSLHLVKDEYQGKGYGTEVESYSADFYKKSKSVSFDVVGERIQRFVKMGFHEYSYGSVISKTAQGKMDKSLVDLRELPLEQVKAYDLSVFGYQRPDYLKALLNQPSNKGLGAIKDGKLTGFALLRKLLYQPGYVISPLMADDKDTATKLLDGLQSYIPGEEVTVSIFHCSPIGMQIMKEQGWNMHHEFLRMYGGPKPKMDLNRLLIPDTY